jgi:hypothetical protein
VLVDVNIGPQDGYTLGVGTLWMKKVWGNDDERGERYPSLPYLRFRRHFPSISED